MMAASEERKLGNYTGSQILGHKRTNHREPKSTDVRYCPKADIRRSQGLPAALT
jgi:hypothetical protein